MADPGAPGTVTIILCAGFGPRCEICCRMCRFGLFFTQICCEFKTDLKGCSRGLLLLLQGQRQHPGAIPWDSSKIWDRGSRWPILPFSPLIFPKCKHFITKSHSRIPFPRNIPHQGRPEAASISGFVFRVRIHRCFV